MEEKNYCVYLHTVLQKVSGYKYKKYYVGITNNINQRWYNNGIYYKGQVFYNAIQKYGWDNIKHTILYKNLTKEEAMEKEKQMIIKYHSKVGERGYNVSDGGEHIIEKRKNVKNIYCIDTKEFFHSATIASKYTKEKRKLIDNRCKQYKNNHDMIIKSGNLYCYTEDTYSCIPNMIKGNTSLIVDMQNKLCYPRPLLEKILKRRIRLTNMDKYINLLDRNMVNNCNRYMPLKDYLYLFDTVKLADFD